MVTEVHAPNNGLKITQRQAHFYQVLGAKPMRYIYRMETSEIYKRIKHRLNEIGMSERQASIKAVGNSQFVRNIRKGNSLSPRGENIIKLAKVLGVSESWLLGTTEDAGTSESEEKPGGIRFGGIVEAGNFRRVNIFNQDAEYAIIPIQPNPHYPFAAQFAFKVEGESMNLEKIFPGMWVHAVEAASWSRIHGEPNDGELVVVEVFRNDNQERELTVKMLRIFRDRVELQPRSSETNHETYIIPHTQYEEFADKYRVKAVVLSSTWLHRFKGL